VGNSGAGRNGPFFYRSLFLLAAAALLRPGAAAAQELVLQLGALRQQYESTERLSSGAAFNQESGALRGPRGDIALRHAGWSYALSAQRASGTVRYDGRTQIGLPLQTTTDLRHTAWSAHVGHAFFGGALELAAGIGERDIDRRIQPTAPGPFSPLGSQGLNERLHSTEWRVAARAGLPLLWDGRVSLEAEWLRNVDARLRVDTLGTFDTTRVRVPDWSGWAARLAWSQPLAKHWALLVQYEWHRFDPPASGTQRLTRGGVDAGVSLRYPGSAQRLKTWLVQVVASW
jgi:hypothetical protein